MKTRKVLSLVLAVVMCAGLLPMTAQAYDMGKPGQYQTISAGGDHSLAIKIDGTLWAWGDNECGQLGDGTTTNRHSPVKVLDNVAAVSAGGDHSLAIQTDGSLWAWGGNADGQLGNGGSGNDNNTWYGIYQTVPVKTMDNVVAVSAGYNHSLAIQADRSLWAWGYNNVGQLGDGTIEERHSPVKVMENVMAVIAGGSCSLAVKTDGSLWAWGRNWDGVLGDGTTTERHSPVKIMDDVAAVSGGGGHSLAVKTDGSLWAWGYNYGGQLGDGTTEHRHSPVKVMENVVAVSAGSDHSLAIQTDGSLWVWGNNVDGQLGVGISAFEERYSPVKVMDNVAAVSAADGSHSLAIQTDGSLWAWGRNWDGELGDGTTEERNSPVKIMDNVKLPATPTVTVTQTVLEDTSITGIPEIVDSNTPSSWATQEVSSARDNGIVPAGLDSNYTGNITRAEFCKVAVALVESLGLKDSLFPYLDNDTYPSFSDTSDPDVIYMAKAGVVTGYGDGRFGPNDPITREQAAVMLTRLAHIVGMDTQVDMGPIYHDAADISSWAVDGVWFVATCTTPAGKAVMGGTGNNCFSPKGTYTREQAFISFGRLYEAVKAPPEKPTGGGQDGYTPTRPDTNAWENVNQGRLALARSGKALVDKLTGQSKTRETGVDAEKLAALKETVNITWPCAHAAHAKSEVPNTVCQAFAQAIWEGLEGSNIDEFESDPAKLTNQIYNSIKSGLSSGNTAVTVGSTTYTVDYNISGMSFLGMDAQVSSATVKWGNHEALLVSTSDPEEMKQALSAFCATLAELNRDVWTDFMTAYVKDSFGMVEFDTVNGSNAERCLELARTVLFALDDAKDVEGLLLLAGDALSDSTREQLKSGWLTNNFADFIKDMVPFGNKIVDAAKQFKITYEAYSTWADAVNNGTNEEKTKALYSEFQSAMNDLDAALNAIPD